jgi:hypothetical protein
MSSQVKFEGDRRWWSVRAEDDRFTVLTRQANFRKKGVLCYTIIDRGRGVRGPCNLIGQGYGDGTYDDAQCAEILAGLRLHADQDRWLHEHRNDPDGEHFQPIEGMTGRRIIWPAELDPEGIYPIEVSYRNNVPVRIEETR